LKKAFILAVALLVFVGVGCASGSVPTVPDKGTQSIEEFFNSFDLSKPAVAEFRYTDMEGNVLASGLLGRDENGLYVLESREAQGFKIKIGWLGLMNCWVAYLNPAGTIQTGPNAGLPYYYIGQTVEYDINILSFLQYSIGGPPCPWSGPAKVTAEMRYASYGPFGNIIAGAPMPGDYQFVWTGVIYTGYQKLFDTYYIPSGTNPGLNVTTVRVEAPVFFGLFDIIFFDAVAGIWDPQ